MRYSGNCGWVINPRKLKADDRQFLKELTNPVDIRRFVDDCIINYMNAWGKDIVDYDKTMGQYYK